MKKTTLKFLAIRTALALKKDCDNMVEEYEAYYSDDDLMEIKRLGNLAWDVWFDLTSDVKWSKDSIIEFINFLESFAHEVTHYHVVGIVGDHDYKKSLKA